MSGNNMRQMRVMIDREGAQASLVAAQAIAEAARDRRLTACETCECAACVEARDLPKVLRILAAAERRKATGEPS